MLKALDDEYRVVEAEDAQKGFQYFCRACASHMILKKGKFKIDHFAHPPDHSNQHCWLAGMYETVEQRQMKKELQQFFRVHPDVQSCELEAIIDTSLCDLLLNTSEGSIAVTCQASHNVPPIEKTLKHYTKRGIYSLYIIHHLCLKYADDNDEVRVPDWIRVLHALYRGRVYVYTDEVIYPVHLEAVSGKSIKKIMFDDQVADSRLLCQVVRDCYLLSGSYRVASFNDRMFWRN